MRAKKKRKRGNRYVVRRGVLPPSAQVMHLTDTQWEDFIEAAARVRLIENQLYARVQRLGNAGDAGRDIEARLDDELAAGRWDLFQGKHYAHRLAPADAFPELAKFFTNLATGTFPAPRHYYFCAPLNTGPQLHDLIANPDQLKTQLLASWQIGQQGLKDWANKLTPHVRALVEQFDFRRIRECLVRDLIGWHALDQKAHHELFGIEPERGDDPTMPETPVPEELVYLEELLRVYREHSGKAITLADVALDVCSYAEHFSGSRAQFYCAEGLKRFSRDLFPEDEFGTLLEMVLKGVKPRVSSPAIKTGLDRLEEATKIASSLQVTESRLATRLRGGDLPGACHHLVNEKKLKWVK